MTKTQFPYDTVNVETRGDDELHYSFCSLVTNPKQYADMVQSFRERGFDKPDCEFLYLDNTEANKGDGYSGLNRLIHRAKGKYAILLHQDILAVDGRDQLDRVLEDLDRHDPNWALAGNAGSTGRNKARRRMTSSMGYNEKVGDLPARVETLDENLMILRREALLGCSNDLSGFHLYGTDLVQQAAFRGWTAYVIDFHIEHLGLTEIDKPFVNAVDAFRRKYRSALKPKLLSTPVTFVPMGRDYLKSLRHRQRLGHRANATTPVVDLKALRRRLSDKKYHLNDDKRGARYTLEGTTFQLPPRSPVDALRAILAGSYEKPERELSRQWLPKDLPAIELGGSYGIVSYVLRDHLDDDQSLTIVEANPDLIEICRNNVALAGRENTEVIQAALAYGQDTVSFTVTEGLHTSHVTTGETQFEGREITVPAVSLDDLLERQGITGEFSLVCDIEGAEFDLFLHDTAALKRCAMAVVEFHPAVFVERLQSVSEFLHLVQEAGFEIVATQQNVLAARRIP